MIFHQDKEDADVVARVMINVSETEWNIQIASHSQYDCQITKKNGKINQAYLEMNKLIKFA